MHNARRVAKKPSIRPRKPRIAAAPQASAAVASPGSQPTVWWHTTSHAVSAAILFLPAVVAVAALAIAYRYIGDVFYLSQEPNTKIGIFARAGQYGIATYLALAIPSLSLKRSNPIAAAAALACVVVTPLLAISLYGSHQVALGSVRLDGPSRLCRWDCWCRDYLCGEVVERHNDFWQLKKEQTARPS